MFSSVLQSFPQKFSSMIYLHLREFLRDWFQTKFTITSTFLSYLQVISAIPKHLLQKSRSLSIRHGFPEENGSFQLSYWLNIDLCKWNLETTFALSINAATIKASGLTKWGKELKVENIKLKSIFDLIGKVCRENKLIEFEFKLITD